MDVGDDWQDGDEGLAVDEAPEGVDEGLEVEEAMEAQEVQILALNVPESLPDLPDELLECIFQNTCFVDRIRIAQVWPNRLEKYICDYFISVCRCFQISYRKIVGLTAQAKLTEAECVAAITLIVPFIGRYITDLCINYNFTNMPSVPVAISATVRAACRNLIKLHIIDISPYRNSPDVMLVPDMTTVESFVFYESDATFNQDKIVERYLAECCGRLESLSINKSCIDGSCLRNLHNLRYLRIRDNLRVQNLLNDNEEPQQEVNNLSISDLLDYCQLSPVRHLDLMQHEGQVEDAQAILAMRQLSHLTMIISHPTTSECVSDFVKELMRGDRIENLTLTVYHNNQYVINQDALDMMETVTRLRQVHLKGFMVNAALLHTLSQMHANRVLETFTLK